MTAVVCDHHTLLRFTVSLDVFCDALGRFADRVYIHIIGSCTDLASQPGSTECDVLVKALFDLTFIISDIFQLFSQRIVCVQL